MFNLRRRSSDANRSGITLFEVVLALAIFTGALAAISQVLRTGSRAAVRAQLASEAAVLCERRMNEALAGIVPLENVSRAAFDGRSGWLWSFNILDSGVTGLLKLEVVVEHAGDNGTNQTRFQLVRLVRDPQVYLDAQALTTGVE